MIQSDQIAAIPRDLFHQISMKELANYEVGQLDLVNCICDDQNGTLCEVNASGRLVGGKCIAGRKKVVGTC